jgi:pilus assembly protein Flp/PilA
MTRLVRTVRSFIKDEDGLELVEYAVMTALIVVALVLAIQALSGAIQGRFTNVTGTIDGIEAAPPAP